MSLVCKFLSTDKQTVFKPWFKPTSVRKQENGVCCLSIALSSIMLHDDKEELSRAAKSYIKLKVICHLIMSVTKFCISYLLILELFVTTLPDVC